MTRRSGMTLVEVLVAIFIMGIGLVALLTLFPIGILRIAQSIRDDKCVSCVINAHALAQVHDVRNDIDVVSEMSVPAYAYDPLNPLPDLFVNPYPKDLAGKAMLVDADPFGASYPILADPVGFFSTGGAAQHWVGGAPGFLRRRPVEFTRRGALAPADVLKNVQRNFTLWDDASFDNGDPLAGAAPGTPTILAATVPPTIARNSRFSWAYVFHRPQTQDRSIVDCSVVVFDTRPLGLTGTLTLAEYVYPNVTYFDPVKNTILIEYSSTIVPPVVPPPVRPGNWIMDASPYLSSPTTGSAHAYFYRVVAADDLVIGTRQFARYEVQTPLRGFTTGFTPVIDPTDTSVTPVPSVYQGTAIVFEGIAEVFEKGPVRLP